MNHFLTKKGEGVIVKDGQALAALRPSSLFAIDIETHGKPIGDCATYKEHGVCGIALCNIFGEAAYVVINDKRDYGGLDINYVMGYLNANWFKKGAVAAFHNCKFDLYFLTARGLDTSRVRVHDTFLVRSIRRRGVFISNALKDVVKEMFGIDTDSQDVIKKWLEENKTEDYGDIPIETMAPYACDDVRYTLAILLEEPKLSEKEVELHDRYVRNNLHLNEAERKGICVGKTDMPIKMKAIRTNMGEKRKELVELLGSAAVNPDDDQQILHYLHSKNLHSGPRDFYGENKYVVDVEFLKSCKDIPLAKTYLAFIQRKLFLENFSGREKLACRQFCDGTNMGYYPSTLTSTFSKGGIPQSKRPDFVDSLRLKNAVRELHIPRKGKRFLAYKVQDLRSLILAFYCGDTALSDAVGEGGKHLCRFYGTRNPFSIAENSLLLKRTLLGRGVAGLEQWYRAADLRGADKNKLNQSQTAFQISIVGFNDLLLKLNHALTSSRVIKDRLGREIEIPPDKQWRSLPILISSSYGGIIGVYFDALCRVMKAAGADLVFAHEGEFLFEAEIENEECQGVAADLLAKELTDPVPKWVSRVSTECWPDMPPDAENVVMEDW